jgi:APA family basic amino acid/polyamine antiporter
MIPWYEIDSNAPFSIGFQDVGYSWMAIIVSVGAMMGILDTVIVVLYSMSRVFVILGRMGLMPSVLVGGRGRGARAIVIKK